MIACMYASGIGSNLRTDQALWRLLLHFDRAGSVVSSSERGSKMDVLIETTMDTRPVRENYSGPVRDMGALTWALCLRLAIEGTRWADLANLPASIADYAPIYARSKEHLIIPGQRNRSALLMMLVSNAEQQMHSLAGLPNPQLAHAAVLTYVQGLPLDTALERIA